MKMSFIYSSIRTEYFNIHSLRAYTRCLDSDCRPHDVMGSTGVRISVLSPCILDKYGRLCLPQTAFRSCPGVTCWLWISIRFTLY